MPAGLPYEWHRNARRKSQIKPLKETNLGVAQPFFLPLKETMLNFDYINGVNNIIIYFACNPKGNL